MNSMCAADWTLHQTLTGFYTECDFLYHSWSHAELWADPQEAHLRHFRDPNDEYEWADEEFDSCVPGSLSGHLLGTEPMRWRKQLQAHQANRVLSARVPWETVVMGKVDQTQESSLTLATSFLFPESPQVF